MAADTEPPRTYRGNCHCKAFVYEIRVPTIRDVYECDCSICRKKGYLLVFVADAAADFSVVAGAEAGLTTYTFGEGKYEHKVLFTGSQKPVHAQLR